MRTLIRSLTAVLMLVLVHSPLRGGSVTAEDELVARLMECLRTRPVATPTGEVVESARTDLLGALRQLKDPALKPLFAQLAAGQHVDFKAHGIMGLAELSDDNRINVLAVAKVQNPAEQALLIRNAMDAELFGPEQAGEVLAWPQLDPYIELVLRAQQMETGAAADTARLAVLAESPTAPTAVLAGLVQAQAGIEGAATSAYERAQKLDSPERERLIAIMLDTIRRSKLTKSRDFARAAFDASAQDWSLRANALRTLIAVAPEEGTKEWLALYAKATGLSDQLRYALIALDGHSHLGSEAAGALAQAPEGSLLRAMGEAIGAVRSGKGVAEALTSLSLKEYRPSTLWSIDRAKATSPETAAAVGLAILGRAEEREPGSPVQDTALLATELTAKHDAPKLKPIILRAIDRGDRDLVQTMLGGLLRSGAGGAWELGDSIAWPDPASEAMATLYQARTRRSEPMEPARREMLRRIALGYGSLPELLCLQAAWLTLSAEGRAQEALAKVLSADASSPGNTP